MMRISKKTNMLAKLFALLQEQQSLGIVLSGISTSFLAASLWSYKATDISWFYYARNGLVSNLCASLGANVAACLLYLLGMSAWMLVVLGSYFTYYWWARHTQKKRLRHELMWLLMMMPFLMASICYWYQLEMYPTTFSGGVAGLLMVQSLVYLFDTIGAAAILHTALLVMLVLLFPQTTWYIMRSIGRLAYRIFSKKTVMLLYHSVQMLVRVMATWLCSMLQFLWQACCGSAEVLGSDQSVITFEQFDAEQELDNTSWQELIQKPMPSGIQSQQLEIKKEEEPVSQSHAKSRNHQPKNNDVQHIAYKLPDISLFTARKKVADQSNVRQELHERAVALEQKLERFGVVGKVTAIKEGPVVTLFEYQPGIDTKISKILALEDDLAMALQALSIRILAPIPGRSVVGFEVANAQRTPVLFADILRSKTFQDFKGALPLILGEDTVGNQVVADLAKMPHLLIAGSTGSGKSVALNGMLISMLCKMLPDDLKLILIDPKRLEFAPYADIPHLLFPIITDPKRVAPILKWVVQQMEERYALMARCGVRNVSDYNALAAKEEDRESLPFLVVVVDELADLMMTAGREVEDLIARLAQMARAAGIHLMVATQRPSVDVITGLIKVNFTSRISFRVTSKVDSRTILDCAGADKLLGRGDMLFLDSSSAVLKRVHGAYVSDKEIEAVIAHIRAQGPAHYLDITEELAHSMQSLEEEDELYAQVVAYVQSIDEVSISLLQRRFRIGYNRSARIIDALESHGLIMPQENGKTRKVVR